MQKEDFDFIFMLEQRPESYVFGRDTIPDKNEITERCNWFFERMKELPQDGAIRWIVCLENQAIGEVQFICNWSKTHEWEIGYKLLKEYWGNGFATEAVSAVIQYVFRQFHVHRIIAFLNTENKRSEAVCKRIGMVRDGCLREDRFLNGRYYDDYVYSILEYEIKKAF